MGRSISEVESSRSTIVRSFPNLFDPKDPCSPSAAFHRPLDLIHDQILNCDPDEYDLPHDSNNSENRNPGGDLPSWRTPAQKLEWFYAAMLSRFIEEFNCGRLKRLLDADRDNATGEDCMEAKNLRSTLEFLSGAMTQVLEGDAFDVAIPLPGRKIRDNQWRKDQRREVALFVDRLIEIDYRHPQERSAEASAVRAASEIFSLSENRVRDARTEFSPRIKRRNSGIAKKTGVTTD